MKNNELRLGNWVYNDENKPVKIAALETYDYGIWNGSDPASDFGVMFMENGEYKYSHINPIIIDQWLLDKTNLSPYDNGYYSIDGMLTISIDGNVYAMLNNGGQEYVCECQYLHSLQNLYFIVNGVEMDITI